jgi:hypothetical protein
MSQSIVFLHPRLPAADLTELRGTRATWTLSAKSLGVH